MPADWSLFCGVDYVFRLRKQCNGNVEHWRGKRRMAAVVLAPFQMVPYSYEWRESGEGADRCRARQCCV